MKSDWWYCFAVVDDDGGDVGVDVVMVVLVSVRGCGLVSSCCCCAVRILVYKADGRK